MMDVMWLIWDGGGAAARVREEVRLRCPDARIVCIDDADVLVELAHGLGDGVRIALGASPGNASDLLHVIRAVRGGSAGHATPAVLACIDGMDAGLVSELFDAGAQEVIATDASLAGSADAHGQDAEAAHMDIGTEVATRGTVASERDDLVPDDPFVPMGYGGDEVPRGVRRRGMRWMSRMGMPLPASATLRSRPGISSIWEMLSDACVSGKWPITAVPVHQ